MLYGRRSITQSEWQYWRSVRDELCAQERLPSCLLLPEMRRLLRRAATPGVACLFGLLWRTGAHISEALALRRCDLVLSGVPGVSILTNQQGHFRNARRAADRNTYRYIPLLDEGFVEQLQEYCDREALGSNDQLFSVTRMTAHNWCVDLAERHSGWLPVPLSANVFRHSYAVNLILHGVSLTKLSELLGLSDLTAVREYESLFDPGFQALYGHIEF